MGLEGLGSPLACPTPPQGAGQNGSPKVGPLAMPEEQRFLPGSLLGAGCPVNKAEKPKKKQISAGSLFVVGSYCQKVCGRRTQDAEFNKKFLLMEKSLKQLTKKAHIGKRLEAYTRRCRGRELRRHGIQKAQEIATGHNDRYL